MLKILYRLCVSIFAVKCSSLKSPNSGTFELLSNGLITRADFNCSMNYHIEGSNPLVCSETGTWNDIEPICGNCV